MEPQPLPVPTPFEKKLQATSLLPLVSRDIVTLQINVGKRCNLLCKHCHVEAGPGRTEVMGRATLEKCLAIAAAPSITTVDITGGAPEMNPHLEWFLGSAAKLGKRLIVRSNLAILLEKEYERFVDIYARNGVELAASLPHWKAEKCDRQRGTGAFDKIVAVIRMLNGRGYGREGSGLVLDLVHNPMGSFLPGPQAALEQEYKAELATVHGITFNKLFCLANSPVGRFREYLSAHGTLRGVHGDARTGVQPVRRGERDVPYHAVHCLGWCDLRLRLQPDARSSRWTMARRTTSRNSTCRRCGNGGSCWTIIAMRALRGKGPRAGVPWATRHRCAPDRSS